jgi:hypothetical protein
VSSSLPSTTTTRPGRRAALALLALAALLGGKSFGDTLVRRLSDHRGYRLISVADRAGQPAVRPRRAFLVLIDGLRADVAAGFTSVARLRKAGVCRRSRVSLPTVSRPVYAVVSTGLEQDRTGSRNNATKDPLAAESVWQVARSEGRRVAGFSELPWWKELFPDGFDRYEVHPRPDDYFARAARSSEDLVLVHPVYVDEAGHDHGAASPEYAAAAVRADGELGRLLDSVDLARDVVLVTADHGHSARGGHGGPQPEVANVMTCYAGPGVKASGARQLPDAATLEQRNVGPLLAVLAGVRFPRHMRPPLPAPVWEDLAGLPADYLRDRQAAEARFGAASAGLPAVYAAGRRAQTARGLLVLSLVAAALTVAMVRRGLSARQRLRLWSWMGLVITAHVVVYALLRGSFDMTSINQREDWIRASLMVGLAVSLAGVLLRGLLSGRRGLTGDQLTLVGLGVGLMTAHVAAFGWVLGFPLPGPVLLFLPFFGATFVCTHAVVALGCAVSDRG